MSTMAGFVAVGSTSGASCCVMPRLLVSRSESQTRRPRAGVAPGHALVRRPGRTVSRVLTIFDGHNDTLTRDDADRFATGRDGGHVDLPRARAGGLGGGIFACYTRTPGAPSLLGDVEAGGYFIDVSEPIDEAVAAPHAARTL